MSGYCINCRHRNPDCLDCDLTSEKVDDWKESCSRYEEVPANMLKHKPPKPVTDQVDYYRILSDCKGFVNQQKYLAEPNGILWRFNSKQFRYEQVGENQIHSDMISYFGPWAALKSNLYHSYMRGIKAAAFERGKEIISNQDNELVVSFKSLMHSIPTDKIWNLDGEHFVVNTIPWSANHKKMSTIIKYMLGWVGKGNVKLLLDICAYTCLADNPEKLIIFLYGPPNSGKSQFPKLLTKFLGRHNIHSTRFELLADKSQRFETYNLRNKLLVISSEIQGKAMYSTSLLKSLSGGDLLRGEKKGIQETTNFVFGGKLIIPTNQIPDLVDNEDTAFKGRAVVIDFPNTFKRSASDIINKIPNSEFEALAYYSLKRLKNWIKNDKIDIHGLVDWDTRVRQYEERSNPLILFVNYFCEFDSAGPSLTNYKISVFEICNAFNDWLISRGLKPWEDYQFGRKFLRYAQGKVEKARITQENKRIRVYKGVRLRRVSGVSKMSRYFHSVSSRKENKSKLVGQPGQPGQDTVVHLKCSVCGADKSVTFNTKGKPVCEDCAQHPQVEVEQIEDDSKQQIHGA